ncbi:class II aldolase/adducin family protein [Oxalobacteraceae bacterium]|nr:class II aldolase/adducin family protein [Oxalobacteraceae bacterium]
MDRLSTQGHAALIAPSPMQPAEWQARVELAACYRLVALHGWDDVIYTHISAAVPDEPGHYLINPFGLRFDEVCASNLVKVDQQGNIVCRSQHRINQPGFLLHGAVHAARHDIACVMHLHNPNAIAVGAQGQGLLPLSPHALRFYEQLAYHDYEGLEMTEQEQERLLERLGQYPAMLLRNHGSLVLGRTIAEAFVLMEALDKACDIQLRAQAGGAQLRMPSHEMCQKSHQQLLGDGSPEGKLEWPALLRKLDALSPTYRT